MPASVHAPVERAYCPSCGEDLGPEQPTDGVKLWCRKHGWVFPISREVFEDAPTTDSPPD